MKFSLILEGLGDQIKYFFSFDY